MSNCNDWQVRAALAKRLDQVPPAFGIPTPQHRYSYLAAMPPLQVSSSSLVARSANRAPAGPRGNGIELPTLIGIGIDQEQRPEDYFFAHAGTFSAKE